MLQPIPRNGRFQAALAVVLSAKSGCQARDDREGCDRVDAVLITSERFEERSKQTNDVPFRAGEFGLELDYVAHAESFFSIQREELGELLGARGEEQWGESVGVIGNMIGSECEP